MSRHNKQRRAARRRQKEQDIGQRFKQLMHEEDCAEAHRQVRRVPTLRDIARRAENGDEDAMVLLETVGRVAGCAEQVTDAPTWIESAAEVLAAYGRNLRRYLQCCSKGHLHCYCLGDDGEEGYELTVFRNKCGGWAFAIADLAQEVAFTKCTCASQESAIDMLAAYWLDFVFYTVLQRRG